MKVIVDLEKHPEIAAGIRRRVAVRRWAVDALSETARLKLDELEEADEATALAFRPALRPDVEVREGGIACGPLELELDAFEMLLVGHSDGIRSLEEVTVLASNQMPEVIDGAVTMRSRQFFAELARYDLLVTGEQQS